MCGNMIKFHLNLRQTVALEKNLYLQVKYLDYLFFCNVFGFEDDF